MLLGLLPISWWVFIGRIDNSPKLSIPRKVDLPNFNPRSGHIPSNYNRTQIDHFDSINLNGESFSDNRIFGASTVQNFTNKRDQIWNLCIAHQTHSAIARESGNRRGVYLEIVILWTWQDRFGTIQNDSEWFKMIRIYSESKIDVNSKRKIKQKTMVVGLIVAVNNSDTTYGES